MTMFEELCAALNIVRGSEAEDVLADMVNALIFAEENFTDEEITAKASEAFRLYEKAMQIPRRPKCYKMPLPSRLTARIGRYTFGNHQLYRKWYVDIVSPFGSDNRNAPVSFDSYDDAEAYLIQRGFKPVY